jgi:choline dehydrogenase-like flavoprotein
VTVDFDYVIVGAGAAGCVLTSRLSEDPGNQVLLLEHGGRDTNPHLYVPEGFYFTLRGNRCAYHRPTRPVGPGGQVEAWMRGKVLGGSTAVNGMMWTRGAAADWDGLAVRGNPEFGWKRVLAAWLDHLPRVGASATGPDTGDVVDPQLQVRGVTGLRVDASVLPVQVAGNTQAPAMAVASIAADLILEDS